MNVYLNEITGMADALETLYLSKRTWTPELASTLRREWYIYQVHKTCGDLMDFSCDSIETLNNEPIEVINTEKRINSFCKWAWKHTAMLDFVTISVTVEGMHRAGQDDIDSHACRFNNRIIRSSTRLADFEEGEMSDYYKDKIIPLGVALGMLDIDVPEKIQTEDGKNYIRSVNGYIREDLKDNQDAKRGLYMESIPSNFIFKCNMAQWAHVYKMRNKNSTANPEVKQCAEMIQDKIEAKMPWFNREFLMKVEI